MSFFFSFFFLTFLANTAKKGAFFDLTWLTVMMGLFVYSFFCSLFLASTGFVCF